MAQVVIMPRQGQSVESCIVTAWHKKVGDSVHEGDLLFSYETDKSAFDEPAQLSGTLLAVLCKEGDVVPCLDPVCVIGAAGEDFSALLPGKTQDEPAGKAPEVKEEHHAAVPAVSTAEENEENRLKISPRARRLALKTGADLSAAVPTGPHGRVIERDVQALLDQGKTVSFGDVEAQLRGEYKAPAAETGEKAPAAVPEAPVTVTAPAAAGPDYTEEPMSNVRKVIARSMHASLSEMAQLTLNSSFDATALLAYRAKLKASDESLGLSKITLNDMILWAVSRILPNHPTLNTTLTDQTLRRYHTVNLGLAVDTERGLLVPVIRHAETLTLASLSGCAKSLAKTAREGKLPPDDMAGGSFTVTNLGSLGVESFTPVINPPQVAILGVCAAVNRVKTDGSVYPAMGLSLTIDHRAVDGAPAAKFLQELCRALENFDLLLAR